MAQIPTFFCVLKAGKKYGPDHVGYLKNSITRSVSEAFRFVCLSDVDVPCERIPLKHKWPGFWSKAELFRKDVANPEGLNVYVDLDVIVANDLKKFLSYPHRFSMTRDDLFPARANSSVMAWTGDHSDIYEEMRQAPLRTRFKYRNFRLYGDQALIEMHLVRENDPPARIEDLFGKAAVRTFRRPADVENLEEALFISFQGPIPKPGTAQFEKRAAIPGTNEAAIYPLIKRQWGIR